MQTELTTRGRKSLPQILGGCALLIVAAVLCVIGAIAVNAAYWTYQVHQGVVGPAQNSVVTETLSTEELMAVIATLPSGDATAGEAVFNSAAACQACHSLEPDKQVVGPSLAGIGSAAAAYRRNTFHQPSSWVLWSQFIISGKKVLVVTITCPLIPTPPGAP